jgi:hypothetical protein
MNDTIELNVPKSLRGVDLEQYQQYLKVLEIEKDSEDAEIINMKAIEIFCKIPYQEVRKLKLSDFGFVVNHIDSLFSVKPPLTHRFEMVGTDGVKIEFGFIPKLDDLSMGEFIDLDNYLNDWSDMHKAMAVLYRPVVYKKGDRYRIEEYKGSDAYSEIMKTMPVDIVMGAVVFFYRLGSKLSSHILDSLEKEMKEGQTSALVQTLEEDGGGIKAFMHSLKETSQGLKKLQHFL